MMGRWEVKRGRMKKRRMWKRIENNKNERRAANEAPHPTAVVNPQRFFNRFESRLGEHSVQLAENTGGQERLETKLDSLAERVDTLTLAMVRPPAKSESVPLESSPVSITNNAHMNGNGQPRTSLGAGFH